MNMDLINERAMFSSATRAGMEDTDNPIITCPYCGHFNVHMETPIVDYGEDRWREFHGIEVRGMVVVIPFWGECPHRWELVLGHHKGTTFTKVIGRED